MKQIHMEQTVFECFCLQLMELATVKPLITNTSEEFIKCRLDNFSMRFNYITYISVFAKINK